DPVAEIFLFGVAAHIGERQDTDRSLLSGCGRRVSPLRLCRAGECGDAGEKRLPALRIRLARPALEIGAMVVVERQWKRGPVDRQLDQLSRASCNFSLGPDPLGLRRV